MVSFNLLTIITWRIGLVLINVLAIFFNMTLFVCLFKNFGGIQNFSASTNFLGMTSLLLGAQPCLPYKGQMTKSGGKLS